MPQPSGRSRPKPPELPDRFAEHFFLALGRPDLAGMVIAGQAGDFPELAAARSAVESLGETFARYEAAFGEIPLPTNNSLADTLFRPFQQPPEPPKEP